MVAFVSAFSGASLRTSSFSTASISKHATPVSKARFSMVASKAVPFLEAPPKLDGSMVGDVGFDPLGFSNKFDINFLREAEVKHGRICMLAIVGWVFPELVYHLPNELYSETNPLAAVGKVGFLPMVQIFLFMMAVEAAGYEKVYEKNCEDPGNYGFDPFGLSKDPKRKDYYQLAELKNGRLAMIAIGGAIHHTLLTNMGLIEQLTTKSFFGGYYVH